MIRQGIFWKFGLYSIKPDANSVKLTRTQFYTNSKKLMNHEGNYLSKYLEIVLKFHVWLPWTIACQVSHATHNLILNLGAFMIHEFWQDPLLVTCRSCMFSGVTSLIVSFAIGLPQGCSLQKDVEQLSSVVIVLLHYVYMVSLISHWLRHYVTKEANVTVIGLCRHYRNNTNVVTDLLFQLCFKSG